MTAAKIAGHVASFGASGSGKSYSVKERLRRYKGRLLIWDPLGEYAEFGRVFADGQAMIRHMQATKHFRCVYQPGDLKSLYPTRFDHLCRLAWYHGNLTLVVEELADVTRPSFAPDSWSNLTRKGRHKQVRIFAQSQRPANVDKDWLGNATLIRTARLAFRSDIAAISNAINVPAALVASLSGYDWIERDGTTGKLSASRPEVLKGASPT